MGIEICSLNPEEFDVMMRFLEKCYRHSRGYFSRRYPHVWRKDTLDYDNKIILKLDGKIVSHVGIFPLKFVVDKDVIDVGGIGGVATLQEYRGRGYMSRLMNFSIEKMRRDGYALSILWGDRQRYGHFGYEVAGRSLKLRMSIRSIEQEYGSEEVEIKRFYGEDGFLKKIIDLHEKIPLRVYRDRRTYELLFNMNDIMVYLSNGDAYLAYFSRNKGVLLEQGGVPHNLIPFIYSFLKTVGRNIGISSLELSIPYYSKYLFKKLLDVCTGWSIVPIGMVKIISLKKLFKSYTNYLSKLNTSFSATFEIEGGERVGLTVDREDIHVEEKEVGRKIVLNERDMVKLLFNGVEQVNIDNLSFLKTVFPLPFYVWSLDHI